MAEAEFRAPYPKYLDWLRYLSAFLLFTYASSKMLGRQFTPSAGDCAAAGWRARDDGHVLIRN